MHKGIKFQRIRHMIGRLLYSPALMRRGMHWHFWCGLMCLQSVYIWHTVRVILSNGCGIKTKSPFPTEITNKWRTGNIGILTHELIFCRFKTTRLSWKFPIWWKIFLRLFYLMYVPSHARLQSCSMRTPGGSIWGVLCASFVCVKDRATRTGAQ